MCPLSATHRTLQATVAFTQSLLHALDLQAHIELYSDHPELANVKPERHPLLDGMQPKISRRRLFGLADRITREPIVQDSGDEPASPEGNRLPQRVPLSHRRLLEQLRRISTKREELFAASIAFADVQIDEQACSACALCAHFCSTAALQFDVSEQEFAIHFSANRCIGCNLCQIACPEDAIQISDTLTLERLFAQDDQVLITGDLVPCTRCRAHTAGRDGQHLCHSCRHGAGLVTSLRDDAGLMTDLLSRITPMHQTNT
jgi:ferredoxin